MNTPSRISNAERIKRDSRRLSQAFKSPLRRSIPSPGSSESTSSPAVENEHLSSEIPEVDSQIAELQKKGCNESELDLHVQKLHEYNEIKDAAQLILGKLAVMQGKTLKELHEDYGLDLVE